MRWWRKGTRNSDLDRELQADLLLEEEEQRESGLSADEARRALGNAVLIREQAHEAWGWAGFERIANDVRYLFAAGALFLAGLGVYGVVMYSVVQRYREIGLRIALGAQRATVYQWVLRDGLLPVAIGAVAGLVVALGATRLVSSLLFQVSPHDPALAAAALSVLLVVGVVACLLPARRDARTEPMRALRAE